MERGTLVRKADLGDCLCVSSEAGMASRDLHLQGRKSYLISEHLGYVLSVPSALDQIQPLGFQKREAEVRSEIKIFLEECKFTVNAALKAEVLFSYTFLTGQQIKQIVQAQQQR